MNKTRQNEKKIISATLRFQQKEKNIKSVLVDFFISISFTKNFL